MKTITIKSNLRGKQSAFEVLALATCCQMPLLINGEKGTAKTQTVLDFAESLNNHKDDSFIIELSEGTKVSHLLGQPDMKALMMDKDWKMNRPISTAKTIIINELDKGSSGVRNSLLSIMAEKEIFDGGERIKCLWETFVGTSNAIPSGEETLPFWDRLLLRYDMKSVSNDELIGYMKDRSVKEVMSINFPTMEEIDNTEIDYEYIKTMLRLISEHKEMNMSNRTLTKLDRLVKAAIHVYNINEEAAILKVAELVAKPIMADLGKVLLPIEISSFNSAVEAFNSARNTGQDGNKMAMSSSLLAMDSALTAIERNPKLRNKYYEMNKKIKNQYMEIYEAGKPKMEICEAGKPKMED